MRKHSFIKILIFLFCLTFTFSIYADTVSQEEKVAKAFEVHKSTLSDDLKKIYETFKELITYKLNFDNIACGFIYLNDKNKNLLIGGSGAVYCGHTMGEAELEKYGFDVVGFGGIFDYEVCDLLERITDKKYKNIVLFGGINDLNIRAANKIKNVDELYCNTLVEFYYKAKEYLLDDNSNIIYIKINPMKYKQDSDDKEFIDRFNNMAMQINMNLENFNYKPYTIKYDSTKEYSEIYMHYNNKVVYRDMFEAINSGNFE